VNNASAALPPHLADLLAAGIKHHQAGRLAEAEVCCRRLLAAQPHHPDGLHLLGLIAHQAGQYESAVELIRQAIQRNGQNAAYFYHLGVALHVQGKRDEALAAYTAAIHIQPDLAEAHCNFGVTLNEQGKREQALAAYAQAIRLRPDYAVAHSNLGDALNADGRFDEAITACRNAISLMPDLAEAHYNLGNALRQQGKHDEAIAAYAQAIRIRPDYAHAHSNMGIALNEQGKLEQALAAYHQAIRIRPDHAEAYCNSGIALKEHGKYDAAIAAYRQALRIKPELAEAFSNLLSCLNYDDQSTADQIFAAHRQWDERYGVLTARPRAYANPREPGRRLKVGYVSADFRWHSVAYFVEPLLRAHNHETVEVFCYAEVAQPDSVTHRLRRYADHWLVTVGLSDDALTQRISKDGIDILVDLAGHSGKNRLRVFARKPAPVQVTWLGYPNTTGLSSIDYRLVDAITDPAGADALASETLVRLEGGFLCYAPLSEAPAPSPPPMVAADAVTFGSFNNPAKLSAATLDAWATLLTRLPKARLILKGRPFADAGTRAWFLARLGERGVATERVELLAFLRGAAAHLRVYKRVDIALDPFPYNGTTTTCEALWMGVPVVTRRGDRHAGRVGASLLAQIGLTELIAGSAEEYVEIALALANDPARLTKLRASLRPRMAPSPLCDAPAFARKIEGTYRKMWQHWCVATRTDNSQTWRAAEPPA
jgi:predicted O-linked N-acetylglucosamine transferase (SPINDLY family)